MDRPRLPIEMSAFVPWVPFARPLAEVLVRHSPDLVTGPCHTDTGKAIQSHVTLHVPRSKKIWAQPSSGSHPYEECSECGSPRTPTGDLGENDAVWLPAPGVRVWMIDEVDPVVDEVGPLTQPCDALFISREGIPRLEYVLYRSQ